jgi:hypothetical protein
LWYPSWGVAGELIIIIITRLDLEFTYDKDQGGEKHPMLSLEKATGQWIQV